MAREIVVTQNVVDEGLNPVLTAPTIDGDVIDTGRVLLWVDNAGVAARTVTILTPVTVDGLELEDLVVTVPAGEQRLIGPLRPSTFGRPVGSPDAGKAYVDYDDVTDVVRGVFGL
ncbi:hypothetical protein B0I33_104501 [Prauserella shujinwangii]|uniref:Uncharacterized protein n=1 Tax=Prauserella shujinwangii TaxID=1453103 RepID=A0A2T0LXC6_9PSEU|nr:hypothetical protein [Prauserella shujinwangii]PRX48683.1 hypothetical protein B0I33_104501 [Prauserella shujinwangii]